MTPSRIMLWSLLLSFLSTALSAQETFNELLANDKKFVKSRETIAINKPSGKPYKLGQGVMAYFPALEAPKTVAIISFYVYDLGKTEYRKKLLSTTYSTNQASSSMVQSTANLFYNASITAIKNTISTNYSAKIITPNDFNEAQKKAYSNYQDKATAFGMWVSKEDNSNSVCESADNFLPILNGTPGDYKKAESLGLLAKDLGVDAVIVVAAEISSEKTSSALQSIGMYMYGPNPVPRIEGQKYIGFFGAGRQEGNAYSIHKYVFNGKDGIPFVNFNKKEEKSTLSIEGLDKTYAKVADELFKELIIENKCGQAKD